MNHRTQRRPWTFLTNHGHALICIARDSGIRLRDLALAVGVTERTAQSIVNDLVETGYVERERVGTRSRYRINAALPLRHPIERDHAVGELVMTLAAAAGAGRAVR